MHNTATNLINLHGSFVRKREQKVRGVRHQRKKLQLYKVVGVMVFLAMLGGFAFSLWFGVHIDRNLKQLAEVRKETDEVRASNEQLNQMKARLFSREHVQAAAAVKLNLYPPQEMEKGRDGTRVRL